ncbi:MAG: class II SORL domain-containing protein [Desulfoarculaceae bacterium]|nr:class II SORL domain-containing protein [Desulfoarculaceae bacterium]
MKKMILLIIGPLIFLGAESALANKSAVRLEAPVNAAQGEKVTITLFVTHSANNFFHHTNRVYLAMNGEEKASWEFSMTNRPEAAEFSRTFEYVMDGPMTLESAAFCNMHGSDKMVTATIGLK